MARLIDLDELVGPDIEVRLNGEIYKLPADCPVELWLAITDPPEDLEDNRAGFEYMQGKVLELFQIRQPALQSIPLGLSQMLSVVTLAYTSQGNDEQTGGEPERPTTRRTRGGTSKRPASRPRPARSQSR